jgi:hypothetical protein
MPALYQSARCNYSGGGGGRGSQEGGVVQMLALTRVNGLASRCDFLAFTSTKVVTLPHLAMMSISLREDL